MAFDPDAYLAEPFDPDAYLAEGETKAPIDTSPGAMLKEYVARADARAPTLRTVAPGLWALFSKDSPEAKAELEAWSTVKKFDPRYPETAGPAFEALGRTPSASLMFAPTGTPKPAITTVKPPRVATTPAAALLKREGVSNLTAGQRAGPQSMLGQMEAVSAQNPLGMAVEREAAKEAFMRAAQNKGVAPGAKAPATVDLQARLKEILDDFDPAYAPIKGKPIPPAALDSLPDAALMPKRGVDARTAAGVKREVENALSVLGPKPQAPPASGLLGPNGQPLPAPPPPPMKATAGDLLKVRENIREQLRVARQAQDFDRLRLLDGAEDVITEALEKSLTPAEAQALRATDRQYARAMTAANAAPAGQTTFTPGQYLRQVERAAGRRTFKKGGAGDLQDLGEAARDVFVDAPMTGYRGAVMSSIPGAKYLAAPLTRWANTPAGKKFLFEQRMSTKNQRPPETFMGVPAEAVGPMAQPTLADLIALLRRPRVENVPALAEDED